MKDYVPIGIPSHFIEVTEDQFDTVVGMLDVEDVDYLAGATYAEYCLRSNHRVVACHDYQDNPHFWLHPALAAEFGYAERVP